MGGGGGNTGCYDQGYWSEVMRGGGSMSGQGLCNARVGWGACLPSVCGGMVGADLVWLVKD